MRIVSSFHDYYDTISAFGFDKTCIYKREIQELKGTFRFNDEKKSWRNHWPYDEECEKRKNGNHTQYTFYKMVIGFCGKLYPLVFAEKYSSAAGKYQNNGLYSLEELEEYLDKEKVNPSERYAFGLKEFFLNDRQSMGEFFDGSHFKALLEEFHKNKCPVFIYGRFSTVDSDRNKEKLVINPKLKDYKFMKVKDPQTAFQEIFMYLSGVLGVSAPETVELSDKQLAKKKGHDDPYSFRKPPGKRGKKQWR